MRYRKIMDRKLLLLMDEDLIEDIKKVLKSPLELSFKLIEDFIEGKLDELKDSLDNIKRFAAGVQSAELKGKNYVIAKMYPYYFAFHQFVHSSFRARQGKVLEEIIKNVLGKEERIKILDKKEQTKLFDTEEKHLPDYDIFFQVDDNIFIIQIRSRDDTGGTTAKTSLVEGVQYILSNYKGNIKKIEYIAFIWEALEGQQQGTTKEKFYDYLKEKTNLDKNTFFEKVSSKEGVKFPFDKDKNINLYLIYGKENFIDLLFSKAGLSSEVKENLEEIISLIADWDDFWMSYQYIGLEYERLKEYGFSYINYIMEFLKKNKEIRIDRYLSMKDYILLADNIALDIMKENIDLPFKNGKDSFVYLRDLVLLLLIYYKKKI